MKKISRTVFGLLGLLIISCATNHAEKPDVSPNTINTQEYSNIEKLLLTKFQYMVISRFSELMLYFGLEKIENDREDFLVYHGTIDTHNVYVRGYFHSDGPTKGIIFLFSVDFEIPRTPEARFLLFEKLSDYISKLYGKPSLSLF